MTEQKDATKEGARGADNLRTAIANGATVYVYPAETTHHDEAPFIMHFPEWYVVVPPLANGSKWIPPGVRPRGEAS